VSAPKDVLGRELAAQRDERGREPGAAVLRRPRAAGGLALNGTFADVSDQDRELALAIELADLADAITLRYFRAADLRVDRKADASEVTEADRGAEAAMRARLADARPGHAVLGEEDGLLGPPGATHRWIIDPIDGTSNFVKGVPVWATLIALQVDDEVVVGVASAPALGRRWWAARGAGAHADGRPITVSAVGELPRAHLAHAGVGTWFEHGRGDAFVDLTKRVWRGRGLGDFWMHCLVAEGAFDVACEPIVSLWDVAAIQVIVEEAGGRFTDLDGRATPDGGSAVSTNGLLHDVVLDALGRQAVPRQV
jgi:histidinol-phosphatase